MGGIETILVHGGENFGLIILGNVVHTGHFLVQSVQYSLSKIQHLRTDAQLLIHFVGSHGIVAPLLRFISWDMLREPDAPALH